jgi:putative flippase GtrA
MDRSSERATGITVGRSNMSRVGEFVRFAIVGGIATAIQYALLILLVRMAAAGVIVASTIAYAASAVVNYSINRDFTFRSRRTHLDAFPKFVIVCVGGLLLNAALMLLFNEAIGLHYLLAQVLSTIATLFWNFALNRTWTFSSRGSPQRCHEETP